MENMYIKCIKRKICKHKLILSLCFKCSLLNEELYTNYIVENYKKTIKKIIINKK